MKRIGRACMLCKKTHGGLFKFKPQKVHLVNIGTELTVPEIFVCANCVRKLVTNAYVNANIQTLGDLLQLNDSLPTIAEDGSVRHDK